MKTAVVMNIVRQSTQSPSAKYLYVSYSTSHCMLLCPELLVCFYNNFSWILFFSSQALWVTPAMTAISMLPSLLCLPSTWFWRSLFTLHGMKDHANGERENRINLNWKQQGEMETHTSYSIMNQNIIMEWHPLCVCVCVFKFLLNVSAFQREDAWLLLHLM